jgi:hypothetical protein
VPETLTYTGTLVVVQCWCGIRHAIPSGLHRQARDKGHGVYCPLGHSWVFSKTRAEELEEDLARERRRCKAERDLREHEERSHAATRGHLTRTKRRVAAGVCPCCGRTFQQLARHMAAKHPGYASASS